MAKFEWRDQLIERFRLGALTKRQQDTFLFIYDFTRNEGCPPTIRDIGRAMKINSPNGVMYHLTALEKRGLITRHGAMARGIRIKGFDALPARVLCPHCNRWFLTGPEPPPAGEVKSGPVGTPPETIAAGESVAAPPW
jgi:SOS-response transcriptional repressor LexA